MLFHAMFYRDRLHPWCIVELLPNACTIIVSRFRRRNDAEAHMKVLRQLKPNAEYDIMFDVQQIDALPPTLRVWAEILGSSTLS